MKIKLFVLLTVLFCAQTAVFASFPIKNTATNFTQLTQDAQVMSPQAISNAVYFENAMTMESPAAPAPSSGGKSQVIALILCIVVGTLGIHRFYLGYTWQGVVQLLTAGGCGIWTLIDLIRIITGDLQPKNGSYTTTL